MAQMFGYVKFNLSYGVLSVCVYDDCFRFESYFDLAYVVLVFYILESWG